MKIDFPFVKDIVLIGGGHTHALVLKKWGMAPLPGVRLTLIDPAPRAAYSGMLPGFVAGHYARDDLDIDLVRLARFAGARFIRGRVMGIDREAREIHVPGRPPVGYDIAAINVGITSEMPSLPGFQDHAIPAKPLTAFAHKWAAFLASDIDKTAAVIGGGVAGCELAMAMAHALGKKGSAYQITLVDRSKILTEATPSGAQKLRHALAEHAVTILEDAGVVAVTKQGLTLRNSVDIGSNFTVGAAGAKAYDWQDQLGLDTENGFIRVNPMLQSSDPAIFATGDCAHLTHAPRTKAGVFAVRQAPILFDNLVARAAGKSLRSYHPQKDYLKLISLGGKRALAEKWGRSISGAYLWHRKDQIDQTFMAQFRDLKPMHPAPVPPLHAQGLKEAIGDRPMCGGCGSKVGRGALQTALSSLPDTLRDDVQSVAGDDSAIVVTGGATQVISTDHLRAFTSDPVVMARIAAVHALGDIWAMGARPQVATATIILPKMTADLQQRTLTEVMLSAGAVMQDVGASIVGGHSSMGAEMTIGFTVTGLCARPPITLRGAQVGDAIVLTQPIGTGVILSAEMQCRAPGDIVAHCLDVMGQGQAAAAEILQSAHAMTDVTGFGLAGHLAGICTASRVGAAIRLGDVPILDGAFELAKAGHASTLLGDNQAGLDTVSCPSTAHGDLMFDPQTAGGLLACVSASSVETLMTQLTDAGYDAALIGYVTDAAEGITFHA